MTHTLHRIGDIDSLIEDYVIIVISAVGFNEKESVQAKRQALEIALDFNPVNIGNTRYGNMYRKGKREVIDNVDYTGIVHIVFDNKEYLLKYLIAIKEADLGQSIVISGLFDEAYSVIKQVGLPAYAHTVQYSLGTFGKTELLPEKEVLEITSMCGHHMVSHKLVNKMVENVKKSKISLEEASFQLAKQCVCGVFNPTRAYKILKELTSKA